MSTPTPARIKVFWQPGCTSCLRTKEFLAAQGIAFESIDVHNDPAGMAELTALGARSVPVVALGGRYTLAQSLRDVIHFLDLKVKAMDMLPPARLVEKLDRVLASAVRYTRQFSPVQLAATFRNRDRTVAALAFHVFRVAEMGLQAASGDELQYESFNDLPPAEWGGVELVRFGEDVRDRIAAWWRSETDRSLQYPVPTYYGMRSMHEVLERTAWHAAQHTRQLMLILETHGIAPNDPLSPEDLAGLPLPDEVWDR
ncbi:MAG TPA: DinB family protein [Burkholderiales bacterium]|nr:DinB family protein [Burkholderiales bacterium]